MICAGDQKKTNRKDNASLWANDLLQKIGGIHKANPARDYLPASPGMSLWSVAPVRVSAAPAAAGRTPCVAAQTGKREGEGGGGGGGGKGKKKKSKKG